MKHFLAVLCGLALSLPALAVELYPATPLPGNGVNWSTTVSLVDADGAAVALASGDTELSCDGGTLTDTTEATSSAAGVATVTFDASTNDCKFGAIVVKGTNHIASIATVHFVVDPLLVYAGTASAYDASTPTGCSATGASLTLNTADQVGSADDGFYNGHWVQPFDGAGEKQGGLAASTEYTYDGTNKVLCFDEPFQTALDSTSVVLIYSSYTRSAVPLNVASGVVESNIKQLDDTAISCTAGESCGID